ncbi:MAG: aldo/keto reductase [Rhodothermales bacterium]|nr:aldo/keto reductase [Rhodothermales bacterium]MBO6778966.1 aldo/keto reductase [Rhodothermales bacterium]
MKTRRLGKTDLELTTVGLGTWAIGGPWDWGWGPQDDETSIRTIHRALDLGINWLDTAPCYGLGHSEEVVGRAVALRRDEVYIATKCGLVWDDPSTLKVYGRLTRESVLQEAEDSLRRLAVDVIDLYQIHWPNPEEDIEAAWEAMAMLKEQGKVRHIGVSNFSVAQMRRLQSIHPIASLQPPYSMLERGFEGELNTFCREQGIGVVPYSPMQAGLLTGAFSQERLAGLPDDDWRRKNRHFQEPRFSRNLDLVGGLRPIADRLGCTLAQLAVAWTLRDDVVTAAIVGARTSDQIERTAPAAEVVLDATAVSEIEMLLSELD